MRNKLISLILIIFLSGCATAYDVDLNTSDNAAIMNGQSESAWIVDSKTNAIKNVKLPEGSDNVAVALLEVFKAQAIAGIVTPVFQVKKARLNTDNVPDLLRAMSNAIPFVVIGNVATSAIENDRGTTHMYSDGGDINMKDSLNRTEVHSVANDGSSASTTNSVDSSVDSSVDNI